MLNQGEKDRMLKCNFKQMKTELNSPMKRCLEKETKILKGSTEHTFSL